VSTSLEATPAVGPAKSRRGRRRFPPWRWVFRIVLLLAAALLVYVMVTLVQVVVASRGDGASSADAVVVLGAAQYDCRPSPVLEQRLDHARELYVDGVASTIVVTGGKRDGDRCTEAQAGADYLRGDGVPDEHLLLEVQGRNTWESLAASARILRDREMTDVVLVTDGYHALRVQAIANELGLNASVSPSHDGGSVPEYLRETGAVAVGRVIGFDRLVDLDAQVEGQIDRPISNDEPPGDGTTVP
jgi:uncharacterized SAM-binding protein YcdF (DUF218 family)